MMPSPVYARHPMMSISVLLCLMSVQPPYVSKDIDASEVASVLQTNQGEHMPVHEVITKAITITSSSSLPSSILIHTNSTQSAEMVLLRLMNSRLVKDTLIEWSTSLSSWDTYMPWLLSNRFIKWVKPVIPMSRMNVYAAGVVQSSQSASTPIWDHGIRGENQVIAIGDSGLGKRHTNCRHFNHLCVCMCVCVLLVGWRASGISSDYGCHL